ncbi:MAG: molybdenum cofactor cytidylyltransferase [Gammaproteobacteria bacterium]|nr:molybdenum cofactor cytidylyltransferase [Gammaproteobacteria bacterium]|tara:strand:- start:825 stop:1514 length:690 start_codon:yes stop_codon:yes gene_type:complete
MGCILKGGGGLYERLTVGAVVLAAGQGSRLGSLPKSLIEIGGIPLIRRQLIALSGAGIDQVVVVLGHFANEIRPVIEQFPITIVDLSEKLGSSQKISVREGVTALHGKLDAILVVPSDMPLLGGQDYTDLIRTFKNRKDGISMVRPVVSQKPGNPVIFDYSIIDLDDASVDPMCRVWWEHHPTECFAWNTENSRYVVDLDTIDDVATVENRLGQCLKMPNNREASSGVT